MRIFLYVHCTADNVHCTAGFVCEVLIGVNYASYRGLVNFNSAVTLALSFQLTAHVIVFVFLISLS